MPHRADTLTGLPRQMALALAITGMLASAAPAAAQQTSSPTPRELWRTYPLEQSGGRSPKIRLPAGSEAAATPRPATPAAARSGGDGGGGSATLPIAVAVGLAALGAGLLLGRRRHVAMAGEAAALEAPGGGAVAAEPRGRGAAGEAAAAAGEAARGAAPPAEDHRPAADDAAAEDRHLRPAADAAPTDDTPPRPAADDAAPAEDLRPASAEPPAPPLRPAPAEPPARSLRAAPEPPPREPLRAAPPPPPTALELEVERLRTGRFERQPWPVETESVWRCEIGWHAGTLSAGFRAMAAPPGRRRTKEVGRSEPQRLWGSAPPEPPTAELVGAADRLAAALLDAGWEAVEGGGEHWYSARFAWPHAEPPPRRVRVVRPTTEQEAVRDA